MGAFIADLSLQDPLDPCDAFYGGRINAIKLYYHVDGEEEIRLDDFTSLYPWVIPSGFLRSCTNLAQLTCRRTSGWPSAPSYQPTISTIPFCLTIIRPNSRSCYAAPVSRTT